MWSPTNTEEIRCFFGILILMGIVKKHRIKDYWETRKLTQNPKTPKPQNPANFDYNFNNLSINLSIN